MAAGRVTRCPPAAVEPTTATLPEGAGEAIRRHAQARAEAAAQADRPRIARAVRASTLAKAQAPGRRP